MPVLPGAEPYSHDAGDVAVLVCHGYTGTPQSMRPWAEYLAEQGFTVRLPLLPGHGTTWQEMNRTRWQDWYAEVETALDELHRRASHVFVAGLSMGGLLATKLAQDHGPEVSGLMLVNPIYQHDNRMLRLLPLLHRFVPSFPGIGSDIKMAGPVELAYDRNPLRSMHSQTQLWSIVVRDLPEVTQPVLLMRSAEDHVVPTTNAAFFLSRISSTDVTEIVLHDSYHVATLDHDAPKIFAESAAFIRRLTA